MMRKKINQENRVYPYKIIKLQSLKNKVLYNILILMRDPENKV